MLTLLPEVPLGSNTHSFKKKRKSPQTKYSCLAPYEQYWLSAPEPNQRQNANGSSQNGGDLEGVALGTLEESSHFTQGKWMCHSCTNVFIGPCPDIHLGLSVQTQKNLPLHDSPLSKTVEGAPVLLTELMLK